MATQSRSALFIVATIFIDAIGFGIVIPVLPRLVMEISQFGLADAIAIGGWMSLVYAGAQFLFGPVMGNLGDRFGRRPVLLLTLGGLALDYLLMAAATTLPLLFLGRLLSGVFGSSYGPAQAALADITPPEDRAQRFGLVGAAFGVGFIVGPAIGGLLGEISHRAPFYAAAGLAALNCLYGLTIFPETLPKDQRRRFDWSRANPLGALRSARALPGMTRLVVALFLWQVASLVYPLTWAYYGIARFGWSNAMIGISLAAAGVSMAVVQALLTGRAVKRFGERRAAMIGILFALTGYLGYAFATETWMAFAILGLMALQSLVQPSLMAMLSRHATADTQGEAQGIGAMAMGLGSIISPLLLNPALSYFTSPDAPFRFAGAAFVIAAFVALIALAVLLTTPPDEA